MTASFWPEPETLARLRAPTRGRRRGLLARDRIGGRKTVARDLPFTADFLKHE